MDDRIVNAMVDRLCDTLPTGIAGNVTDLYNANPYVTLEFSPIVIDSRITIELKRVCAKITDNSIREKDIIVSGNKVHIDCSNLTLTWKVYTDYGDEEFFTVESYAKEVYDTTLMEMAVDKFERGDPFATGIELTYGINGKSVYDGDWFVEKDTEADNATIFSIVANFIECAGERQAARFVEHWRDGFGDSFCQCHHRLSEQYGLQLAPVGQSTGAESIF